MYNSMYQAVKSALAQVDGLEDVQWYNNQYEGVIGIAPAVFVEFTPLEIEPIARMSGQTDIRIRLHVVSEVISEHEGDIPDTIVADHHALADDVIETIEGYCLPFDNNATRPLELTNWTPEHKYNGWLVTLIDLTTIG